MRLTHRHPVVEELFRTLAPEILVTHVKTVEESDGKHYQFLLGFRRRTQAVPMITVFLDLTVGEGLGISLTPLSTQLWLSEEEDEEPIPLDNQEEGFNIALSILLYLASHYIIAVCKRQEREKLIDDILRLLESKGREESEATDS